MTEPLSKVEHLLQQVEPAWDAARSERTLPGAQRKRTLRARRAWAAAASAAMLGLACAVGVWQWRGEGGEVAQVGQADGWRTLAFADGSVAYLRGADTRLVVSHSSPALTEIALEHGHAKFEVTRRPERRFQVNAGTVVVQVIGTAFEVAREAGGTRVEVSRGRVAVRWPNGTTELGAGQAHWIALDAQAQTAVPPAGAPRGALPGELADRSPARDAEGAKNARSDSRNDEKRPAQSWRQHAEQGDFTRAYSLLQAQRDQVADDVEELLLAADAARLSGHPAQALPFLRKVVDRHDGDPRAPLAAFTLGGVLLNQLGHPREAQSAYARARVLSPNGSLAQDALAREVEAAHRAGDPARARALALEYLDRHPDGRRVQAVRRFGGLP
jgi:transmembrane sensor